VSALVNDNVASLREDLEHYRLAAEIAGLEIRHFCIPERRHVIVGGMRLYLDWEGRARCRSSSSTAAA
jgi:hypothetical protein